MTFLVGVDFGHYALITADTRTTSYHPYLGEISEDGNHKIAFCNMGLITGSGYSPAINSVIEKLFTTEIIHIGDLLSIIEQYAFPKLEDLHKERPDIKGKTCFLISYRTPKNNKQLLRLSLIHPQWDYNLAHIEYLVIVPPYDTNEKDNERYQNYLQNELVKISNKDYSTDELMIEVFQNILENIKIIAQCYIEISKLSTMVSDDIDFATLLRNGTIIYGYGKADNIMKGDIRLSIIPITNKPRILTPDIFNEGKIINIP